MMRSPEQQYALAKTLPISELTKVLQGQSDVVDMWVAESTMRQKMQAQTAQQGMAAQAVAQGPKVVERDLAMAQQMSQPQMPQTRMDSGVAGLPADVDVPEFAGGGIVAFSRGGLSADEIETNRLREEIRRRYAFTASPLGMFSAVKPGEEQSFQQRRSGLQDLLGVLPNLNKEQLVNLNKALLDQEAAAKASATPRGPIQSVAGTDVEAQPGGFYGGKPAATTEQKTPPAPTDKAGLPTLTDMSLLDTLLPKPTARTLKDISKERKDYYKELGIPEDPYAKSREMLEKDRATDAESRREAGWSRLLEAGLGIMGGESPYALTNIGKGAQAAAKGAAEDLKDFRKIERERKKTEADLELALINYRKSGADADLAKVDKEQTRLDSIMGKRAELGITLQVEQAKAAGLKDYRGTEQDNAIWAAAQKAAASLFDKDPRVLSGDAASKTALMNDISRAAVRLYNDAKTRGASSGQTTSNVVAKFDSKGNLIK